jgi:hypothetical protein
MPCGNGGLSDQLELFFLFFSRLELKGYCLVLCRYELLLLLLLFELCRISCFGVVDFEVVVKNSC